mgnify:CR=1 FL=1
MPAGGATCPDLQVAAEHHLARVFHFHIDAQIAIDQHHIAEYAEFPLLHIQAMVEVMAAGKLVEILRPVFLHGAGMNVAQIVTQQGRECGEVALQDRAPWVKGPRCVRVEALRLLLVLSDNRDGAQCASPFRPWN